MEPIINSQLPEFKVQAFQNGTFKTVTNEDVKGKWAVFFFYPADFTFVCPTELVDMAENYDQFQAMGVEESRKTRFDLGEELSDVLITFEQKIYNKHLDVRVDLPDKPVWTRAERDSITQVIYNLIDNAIKFCPDGGRLALRLPGKKPLFRNILCRRAKAETKIRNRRYAPYRKTDGPLP